MARIKPEFVKRNTKIIGLTVSPVDCHAKWAADIKATRGFAPNYPIIGDTDLSKSSGEVRLCTQPTTRNLVADNTRFSRNCSIKSSDPNFLLDGCLGRFGREPARSWLSFRRLQKLSSC
jgi:thioredoxin-dependent peroxiredoxin